METESKVRQLETRAVLIEVAHDYIDGDPDSDGRRTSIDVVVPQDVYHARVVGEDEYQGCDTYIAHELYAVRIAVAEKLGLEKCLDCWPPELKPKQWHPFVAKLIDRGIVVAQPNGGLTITDGAAFDAALQER